MTAVVAAALTSPGPLRRNIAPSPLLRVRLLERPGPRFLDELVRDAVDGDDVAAGVLDRPFHPAGPDVLPHDQGRRRVRLERARERAQIVVAQQPVYVDPGDREALLDVVVEL